MSQRLRNSSFSEERFPDVKSSISSRATSAKHVELFLDNLTEIIDLANKTCKEEHVDLDAIKGIFLFTFPTNNYIWIKF